MSLDVPLFFLLKGDHPTLPEAEVRAIMEAEGYDYNLKRGAPQILRCRATLQSCEAVSRRALYTHICAEEIFNSEDREAAIISAIREVNFKKLLEPGERFSLRIRRVRGSSPDINIAGLRNDIGKLIKTQTRASLNLDRPKVKFLGVFSKGEFFFVKILYEVKGRPMERRAKNREFFHPSTLQPKLAGCMVNLTRVKPPQPLLDPFCGSGAILIEARVLGCSPIGMDISSAMAMGSMRNLGNFNENFHGLVVGDARRMPFLEISAIATDPPYGRTSSTRGVKVADLYNDFLNEVSEHLTKGGYLCMGSPRALKVTEVAKEAGFKPVESHLIPVHDNLTRDVAVFRRN